MPTKLEPIRRVKCTYKDCDMSFETEKAMRSHKKHSDEHEYCHKCNEDFDSYDDYIQHKITRPEEHDKACRVCGDEFKSDSGLRRHIELNHKIDQKLTCIGCHKSFYRACLFMEHLEFGHCDVISASQFQGHIVHKHLITELLKAGPAYERFMQKTSKFDATLDYEQEGGVELEDDALDADEDIEDVKFEALKPDTPPDTPLNPAFVGPYPPLPSSRNVGDACSRVASTLGAMSLSDGSESSTVVGSHFQATSLAGSMTGHSTHEGLSPQIFTGQRNRQPKVWGNRNGKSATTVLFPNAKPTPAPSEFSIAAHDEAMEQSYGFNIMSTRFWDPMSSDWNPERFYNSVINMYNCPFICEQTFGTAADLNTHILGDHRITRMKCPTCLKYFKSATALMGHCESRGAKCQINKAEDYNIFLDRLSGGFLGVEEMVRPDHLNNPTVMILNHEKDRLERYKPPVASYLQYMVTKPPDWKEPVQTAVVIGGPAKDKYASQW
ncbi:uncharacterized protein K460DRAFT_354178 [Cucurbitaria berberidis CBS 394.84]|uniref:C2H2-type domain-containing protein n=1 Tax=Cucurbitaria berberidis CBS 394.84 TaxID=1168544 RepID=A0A9P4GPG4_9PLEO|nr:uncharacterized protein K460DRAFT_354178 [Cucurbitaria berberidis CBS 394.84]KAF1849315.1 hypothetical protein K460DRAFT_354178 [Cucurbitaria berberidis CBS 394.84]